MTVSTIISHLTGKAPRVFSRRLRSAEQRKLMSKPRSSFLNSISVMFEVKDKNYSKDDKTTFSDSNMISAQEIKSEISNVKRGSKRRRKLLWEKENWGDLREEAVSNIIGYFGSINPGSVGWCTGTPFQKQNKKKEYYCDPEFPTSNDLPWMVEGGLGNDEC